VANEYHDHEELKLAVDDASLWITLSNSEKRNALTPTMIDSLVDTLIKADRDSSIRAIVITGEGKGFSAGGDLKAMIEDTGMFKGSVEELRQRYMHGIQMIPRTIESLQTPVIAMVNGAAIGAGCDLAMMCDLRIGCEASAFGETFSKLALVPGDGGAYFLIRAVGYAKAMEMILTGDIYRGEQAHHFGLLNFYVEAETLKESTKGLVKRITSNSPVAMGMSKKALRHGYREGLDSHLDLLAAFQGITQRSEDHKEGVKAFLEKRAPQFTGH
jgi:2-(1,2-epoxy-1,2-dihydrophenyl)acetyl-CoA isomerase